MDEEQTCNFCGAAVTNAAVTGILCSSCYEEQSAGPQKLTNSAVAAGLVALAVSFVISIEVNGVDYVQGGAGAVALIAGGVGAMMAKSRGQKKAVLTGVVVALVGALQAFRGLGPMFFWAPGDRRGGARLARAPRK